MDKNKLERVQKVISNAGYASRRKAEELIKNKKVKVNGEIALIGQKVSSLDKITVEGNQLPFDEKVYYIINKPEKTICSLKDPQRRSLVIDLINDNRYLFTVGRLDYNTTGTLLVTNDGDLTNKLTHPSFEIERVYRARLNESLTNEEFKFLNSNDVYLEETHSIQKVSKISDAPKSYVISLHQGTYHHVKKLFELVNKKVISLTRIQFAGLSHIGLKSGEYRKLTIKELRYLKTLINKK